MRLGMVSQWYDPEGGSAAVAGATCRALAALGHEMHVLTGFPNYPTGRIYPGYRYRSYQYELRSGVHVHRVPLLPSRDRSALRRAMTYLSFCTSAAVRPRILSSVDAWIVFSTPATAALPALVARSLYQRPYLLFIQDLWPDTVVASGFLAPGWMREATVRGISVFCDATYRRAAAVVATTPGMAQLIHDRGVPSEKLTVVPNWVDESVFRPVPRDRALAERLGVAGARFVLMYAGSLGEVQDLETVVAAVRSLTDLPGLRLVFAGSGVAEPRLRAAAAGAPHITFLGQQPVGSMAGLLALGDAQLVSLRDLPVFRSTMPSKVQAVLAAGRPMVAAVPGDAARLVERSGAGVAVPPGNVAALAAAIRQLYIMDAADREAMGERGRRYYQEHLSARVGSAALAEAAQRALRPRPAPVPARGGRR